MNLNELRTFLEVIETGSLVAASQRLNVTQSTVTARISALEEEVGQKLLHRYKSGAELTSAGFKFRRYAEVMVHGARVALADGTLLGVRRARAGTAGQPARGGRGRASSARGGRLLLGVRARARSSCSRCSPPGGRADGRRRLPARSPTRPGGA